MQRAHLQDIELGLDLKEEIRLLTRYWQYLLAYARLRRAFLGNVIIVYK